eukprot:scaffold30118_cov12-Tisochrysis_lutea.AAC.1
MAQPSFPDIKHGSDSQHLNMAQTSFAQRLIFQASKQGSAFLSCRHGSGSSTQTWLMLHSDNYCPGRASWKEEKRKVYASQ